MIGIQSNGETLSKNEKHAHRKWGKLYFQYTAIFGRRFSIFDQQKDLAWPLFLPIFGRLLLRNRNIVLTGLLISEKTPLVMLKECGAWYRILSR